MIDIHSHILFDVDDGAKTIEESIELIKQAEKKGYTDIVCSSHYYIGRYENTNYIKNFQKLKQKIDEEKINIRIYQGNEFALKEEGIKDIDKVNRINFSRYILIELKGMIIYPICKNVFQELLNKGIVPIFAHIERYPHIKEKEFIELFKMGVILQVNTKTVLSLPISIKKLFEKKYIGLIATDTHKYGHRDYNLDESLEKLKKLVDEEYFKNLTEINPRKIINNEKIDIGGILNENEKVSRSNSIFSSLWNKLFRV